jgi:hypothetical protein
MKKMATLKKQHGYNKWFKESIFCLNPDIKTECKEMQEEPLVITLSKGCKRLIDACVPLEPK